MYCWVMTEAEFQEIIHLEGELYVLLCYDIITLPKEDGTFQALVYFPLLLSLKPKTFIES